MRPFLSPNSSATKCSMIAFRDVLSVSISTQKKEKNKTKERTRKEIKTPINNLFTVVYHNKIEPRTQTMKTSRKRQTSHLQNALETIQ